MSAVHLEVEPCTSAVVLHQLPPLDASLRLLAQHGAVGEPPAPELTGERDVGAAMFRLAWSGGSRKVIGTIDYTLDH